MNNKNRKTFFDMSLKEIGDEVVEKLVGLVVRAEKPEPIERLTFTGLMSRASLLTEKYPSAVNCKCVIFKDKDTGIFKVGLWGIDTKNQIVSDEYGEAQKMLDAASLDDKLYSFLNDSNFANFILELNK